MPIFIAALLLWFYGNQLDRRTLSVVLAFLALALILYIVGSDLLAHMLVTVSSIVIIERRENA